MEKEQEEIEKRVLGSTNIKRKGKARERAGNQGEVSPRHGMRMILGKKQWSSMLKGMVLILLRNFNSYGKLPRAIE